MKLLNNHSENLTEGMNRPLVVSRPVSSFAKAKAKGTKPAGARKKSGGGSGGSGGGSQGGGGGSEGPRNWWRWIKFISKYLTLLAIWGGLGMGIVIGYFSYDMPDIHQISQPERAPSIVVMDDENRIFARYGDLFGQRVTLNEVSPQLIQAIVAIEDRRFYNHFGIDVFGLFRAFVRNIQAGRVVQGGSTLTQQLAKNLFLTPDRTFRRKVQEMLLAFWLERTYNKEQIMTAYINRVYLGAGTYGVDAAADMYYGKSAKDLDLRQAATIAGLLRAPSAFSPANDSNKAAERSKVVLRAMLEEEYITEPMMQAAMTDIPLPRHKPGAAGDGRYFGDWILSQVNGLLDSTPQDLIVTTTLDMKLQRLAERQMSGILSSDPKKEVSQGALITLSPDGAVRAMVGGRDYDDSKFNRATQAKRQPGSSFKPFVYLAALSQGMSPNDVFDDSPLTIGKWRPENYDDKFRGSITARQALAESVNIVAIRILQNVGIPKLIQTARAMGITSDMSQDLSLALGTNVVSPLELTGAYATIASGGRAVLPYAIKEIKNRKGQILYRRNEVRMPSVADPMAVTTLIDMMTEVVKSGTGKRAALDRPVAGKTGTSSDYRDAWFLGFTGNYTTGVWLGNDDNHPMKKVTGGSLPAQLWHDYMIEAEAPLPARPLMPDVQTAPQDQMPTDGTSRFEAERSKDNISDMLGDFIRGLTSE